MSTMRNSGRRRHDHGRNLTGYWFTENEGYRRLERLKNKRLVPLNIAWSDVLHIALLTGVLFAGVLSLSMIDHHGDFHLRPGIYSR